MAGALLLQGIQPFSLIYLNLQFFVYTMFKPTETTFKHTKKRTICWTLFPEICKKSEYG